MNPIREDLPYPTLDDIEPDMAAARVISPAYAADGSELTAVSQYIYHHFQFYRLGLNDIAETMVDIAITEMTHLDMLGKMLVRLGIDPIMSARPPQKCNFFNTGSVCYSTAAQKMIMDDIRSENDAIAMYKCMLRDLSNQQVEAVIQRIIMDEELHVRTLSGVLSRLVSK